ncbi:MAG TPA: M20 family metallopeptidase, partial [Thermoanaerobacterales bacterium]|nr:M20 family metallopeptidase [Thermoanaerobacterales bacterium]
ERGICGLPTAFKAVYRGKGEGPTVAFLAEYDALVGMGHACGHNLIGPISIGAAIALREVMDDIAGSIVVFGTPAEETDGAKVMMSEKGVFDSVDAAMMVHPSDKNSVLSSSLAMDAIEFVYTGKAAHAAAVPHEGINALDAVIILFNSINALRQQLKDDVRIHGIISEGGVAPNIIPERAVARFYIRAAERLYVDEVVEKVLSCAKGAALATGAKLSTRNFEVSFDNLITNETLAKAFEKNMKFVGVKDILSTGEGPGSTDMGNVSHRAPAIHPYIAIAPEGTPGHSKLFLEAAASPTAHDALILAAKSLALTGYDVLTDSKLLEQIKQEFREKVKNE